MSMINKRVNAKLADEFRQCMTIINLPQADDQSKKHSKTLRKIIHDAADYYICTGYNVYTTLNIDKRRTGTLLQKLIESEFDKHMRYAVGATPVQRRRVLSYWLSRFTRTPEYFEYAANAMIVCAIIDDIGFYEMMGSYINTHIHIVNALKVEFFPRITAYRLSLSLSKKLKNHKQSRRTSICLT